MSEFCRRLKLLVADELKAPTEYQETADALYKEVMNNSTTLEEATRDFEILRKYIPDQENQHHTIVTEMYNRRCRR